MPAKPIRHGALRVAKGEIEKPPKKDQQAKGHLLRDQAPDHASKRGRVPGRRYLWSHCKPFLQQRVDDLVRRLAVRNLQVSAGKTQHVRADPAEQSLVGDATGV